MAKLYSFLKYHSFFLLFLFLYAFNSNAQNIKIDSLKNLLKKEIHDSTKVKALNSLADEFIRNNPDTSLIIIEKVQKIIDKNINETNIRLQINEIGNTNRTILKNVYLKQLALSYNYLGEIYKSRNTNKRIDCFQKAYLLAIELEDDDLQSIQIGPVGQKRKS